MPFTSGLSAMVRLGAAFELDAENRGACMETLLIGARENSFGNYELEIAGQWLCYDVRIVGGEVRTGASLVDSTGQPQTLLRAPDVESGWELIFRFISSLEKHEVKSLARPIVVGMPGEPDAWVISYGGPPMPKTQPKPRVGRDRRAGNGVRKRPRAAQKPSKAKRGPAASFTHPATGGRRTLRAQDADVDDERAWMDW